MFLAEGCGEAAARRKSEREQSRRACLAGSAATPIRLVGQTFDLSYRYSTIDLAARN